MRLPTLRTASRKARRITPVGLTVYGIKRCVMGENETFVGGEGILKVHGVEVINLGALGVSASRTITHHQLYLSLSLSRGRSRFVQGINEDIHQGTS